MAVVDRKEPLVAAAFFLFCFSTPSVCSFHGAYSRLLFIGVESVGVRVYCTIYYR